jgi:predicted Zn-dependent peptidase
MGYWLPGMTAERLRAQQEVVVAERANRYENVPYGAERFAIAAGLYPEGHPHRYLTIGKTEHIVAATLADVHAFYRTWYVPANATLVIAGDVEPAVAFDAVERYFGSFPACERPLRAMPTARVEQPVVAEVADRFAALGRIHRAWLGPAAFADDEPELDLVTAAWTATGTGKLWRALVYDTQLAQRVSAWTVNSRLGGELHVTVDVQTGADRARVRAILDRELAAPIDREALARQLTRREAASIWSLTGLTRRAQLLHRYALYTPEPDGMAADLARYRTVTPETATAAVQRWARPDAMIEIETVPHRQ